MLAGLYTKTTAVSGCARSVARIVAVSCLLLTNDVVRDVPFHTTTALLSKLLPVYGQNKPTSSSGGTARESEVTDGVEGQEEQEMAGSSSDGPSREERCGLAWVTRLWTNREGRLI